MQRYYDLSKFKNVLLLIPILLSLGCANLGHILSESKQLEYNFRETRWGYNKQLVLLAEQGKSLYLKTEDVLVFNHRLNGIPIKLVYTFKNNRLRAAGYITDKPVKGADTIVKRSVEELGEPDKILNDGMIWLDTETLVYSNAYVSWMDVHEILEKEASGGVLTDILGAENKPGSLKRWDGVWAYIDLDFYNEIHERELPLYDLSTYEKLLFGVLKRKAIHTYYYTREGGVPREDGMSREGGASIEGGVPFDR